MPVLNEKNRKWWVLAAAICVMSMIFIDQTAPGLALPAIQRDFHTSAVTLQWVINGYLLSLSVFLIFAGRLGDLYGHRRMFLSGLVVFIAASVSCGFAPNDIWLVASRAVQGIGGAMLLPATSTSVFNIFPANERGKAIGLYIGISALFLSLGPLVGGLLTTLVSWRLVFWINFPIAIIGFSLAYFALPKDQIHAVNQQQKPDWLGFIFLAMTISSFIIALMESSHFGWTSMTILTLLCVAIASLVLFIFIEKRKTAPLVNFVVFQQPYFVKSIIILMLMQAAFISIIFWGILLQNVYGYTSLQAGIAILPATIPVMFMAPLGGKIRDKYGARLPILIGGVCVLLSALNIAVFAGFYNYWLLMPGFFLFGCGVPFVISACMTTALSTVPGHQRGMAAGMVTCGRQLGSTLGIAIIGAVIASLNQHGINKVISQNVQGMNHAMILTRQELHNLFIGTIPEALKTVPHDVLLQLTIRVHKIYTYAFSSGMYLAVGLAVIALLLAVKMPNRQKLDFTNLEKS